MASARALLQSETRSTNCSPTLDPCRTGLSTMGWQPPVVLKPVRQGSSVGLQFVERVSDWSKALAEAMRYERVLMEEKIAGRETTVGILNGEALPLVEVRPKQGVYDYATKYTPGAS